MPVYDEPLVEEQPKPSLLSRMPNLIKRPEQMPDEMPEQELIETYSDVDVGEGPGDERIKTKIADVIKARVRSNPAVQAESVAPLTKGRGRGPDPLVLNTAPQPILPPEPPLTAAASLGRAEPPLTAAQEAYAPEPAQDFVPEPVPGLCP